MKDAPIKISMNSIYINQFKKVLIWDRIHTETCKMHVPVHSHAPVCCWAHTASGPCSIRQQAEELTWFSTSPVSCLFPCLHHGSVLHHTAQWHLVHISWTPESDKWVNDSGSCGLIMTAEAKKQGRGMVCIAWVLLSETSMHLLFTGRASWTGRTKTVT